MISDMPTIFKAVNVSLKIKNEAENISIYTSAAVRGIIYPRSYLDTRYT